MDLLRITISFVGLIFCILSDLEINLKLAVSIKKKNQEELHWDTNYWNPIQSSWLETSPTSGLTQLYSIPQ